MKRFLILISLLLLIPALLVAYSTAKASDNQGVIAYCLGNKFCYLIAEDHRCYISRRCFDAAIDNLSVQRIPPTCNVLENNQMDDLVSRLTSVVMLPKKINKWLDGKIGASHDDKTGRREVRGGLEGGNGSDPAKSSVSGSMTASYEQQKGERGSAKVEGEIRIKIR
jgi:hypothetical protein